MLLVVSLLAFLLPGHADFGDFSGGSDFGGSDWGGSDWGSSDSDWDYSVSGSSSSDGPMDTVFTFISIVVIGVGVAGWITENFGSKSKSRSRSSGGTKTYTWGFKLRDDYSPIPGFNAESVRADCCDLYRRMQDAWGQGDLSPLQADFTPEAYAQYDRQLRQKTERGEHAHCEVRSVSAQERGWNENDHEWMFAEGRLRLQERRQGNALCVGAQTAQDRDEPDSALPELRMRSRDQCRRVLPDVRRTADGSGRGMAAQRDSGHVSEDTVTGCEIKKGTDRYGFELDDTLPCDGRRRG